MALHTLSITSAHKDMCIPLRGSMDVALNEVVDTLFSVTFFTETFETFKVLSNLDILDFDGNVTNEINIGGRPGLFIKFMFNPDNNRWIPVSSQISSLRRRLKRAYPWEQSYVPSITLSANKNAFVANGTVVLTAITDDINPIQRVEFYRKGVLLATDKTTPYTATDQVAEANNGIITYVAKMFNTLGNSYISNSVDVAVSIYAGGILPPVISIVADKDTISDNDTVTITATASDDVGVTKVEFYRNNVLVGSSNQAPYVFTENITYVNSGNNVYTAKAYDASNQVTTSDAVSVLVAIPAPHQQPNTTLDAATQGDYSAAVAGAPVGTKRLAAANAIVTAFNPDHRLYIYKDGYLVVPIQYTGGLTVVDDGYDVYVQPSTTIDSSDPVKAGDLAVGTWWYELQGGSGYNRIITGSVGNETSNADLTLQENPTPGQGISASIKLVLPRSLDGLS